MKPGDGVGYIGSGLVSPWLGVNEAQILAIIPAYIYASEGLAGRSARISLEMPDRYWQVSEADREAVLRGFREVGAKWAFADHVPETADLKGWTELARVSQMRRDERPFVYFLRLW